MKRAASSTSTRSRRTSRDRAIAEKLIAWFTVHQRDLPWRRTRRGKRCAWAALVAEAMLQQTQVARVIDRFTAFMAAFPTPAALAHADEQQVLLMWQGLGYYRRARHLHRAAQIIVEKFGGRVPQDAADLMTLPGVGRYTAGAIASIVFGRAEPIVDGNVHRVLTRLDAVHHAANGREGSTWSWSRAQEMVKAATNPAVLNEALMELGATVCTPRAPDCTRCPVARHCIAKARGEQGIIPPAKLPAAQYQVHHHAIIIRCRTSPARLLLEQRPRTGLWAGMWQVPTIESCEPLTIAQLARRMKINANSLSNGGRFDYQTTHRRITFHIYSASLARANRAGVWRERYEIDDLPMSNAQRRILREFAS